MLFGGCTQTFKSQCLALHVNRSDIFILKLYMHLFIIKNKNGLSPKILTLILLLTVNVILHHHLNSLEITPSRHWVEMLKTPEYSPPGQKTESPCQIPGAPLTQTPPPPPLGQLPPLAPPQAQPHPVCPTLWASAPLV